jgi:capsular polysaccharide biosynthesis protein
MNTCRKEISLVQLFWKVLLGWKIWLAAAVVMAVLFPAVRYMSAMRAYQQAQNNAESGSTEEAAEFTDDEQKQIDDVLQQQTLLNKYETYYEDSVLMNIDPYHEKVLVLQYYVDSDYTFNYTKDVDKDYTSAVTNTYVAYVANTLDTEGIWSEAGIETEDKNMNGLITADYVSDNIFRVRVIYTDEDDLQALSKVIKDKIEARSTDFSEQIGSHTLVLTSEEISEEIDNDLVTQQSNTLTLITNCKNQITNLETSMSDEQIAAVDEEVAKMDSTGEDAGQDDEAQQDAPATKPSLSVKNIVLGFLLGLFLAAAILACVSILSNRLQDSEELTLMFGLRRFAIIPQEKRTDAVTGLLLRLKNSRKKRLTTEAAQNLAVSNVALYCRNEGITKLFLTGTEIERADQKWIKDMAEALTKQGVSVIYGENVCYDAAAMCKAADAGHVVLVETEDVSIYQEIVNEIRMLKDQNVEIIGYVALS